MNFINLFRLNKNKNNYPKDLIGFDFSKINKNDEELYELQRMDSFKKELSEKIYNFNQIKLFKLSKAKKIISEYNSLEKEIWG